MVKFFLIRHFYLAKLCLYLSAEGRSCLKKSLQKAKHCTVRGNVKITVLVCGIRSGTAKNGGNLCL